MNSLPSRTNRFWRISAMSLLGGVCVCLSIACGPPQVAPSNLRLTASLRTALSARNADWLQKNVDLIEERRRSGEMGDAEYEFFQQIVSLARKGQWDEAEREAVRLQKAQRPTAEQVRKNALGESGESSEHNSTHSH